MQNIKHKLGFQQDAKQAQHAFKKLIELKCHNITYIDIKMQQKNLIKHEKESKFGYF